MGLFKQVLKKPCKNPVSSVRELCPLFPIDFTDNFFCNILKGIKDLPFSSKP